MLDLARGFTKAPLNRAVFLLYLKDDIIHFWGSYIMVDLEISKKGNFLVDLGAITFDKNFVGDRVYSVKLPRPTPIRFLEEITKTASELSFFWRGKVHLVGIPNSGLPISTAIGMGIYRKNPEVYLSIFDPEKFDSHLSYLDKKVPLVLIDNSIKSGDTINKALKRLTSLGYIVASIVTLLNREEYNDFLFRAEYPKVPVIYLYSILDIIDFLESQQKSIVLNYLKEHGNHKAKIYCNQIL